MSKPELLYFPIPGRGLPVRVALFTTFGKDGWTDSKITFDEYGPAKAAMLSGNESPMKAAPYLPLLTLSNGIQVGEAVPMTKWAATAKGPSTLYPEGDERLMIDEAIEIMYATSFAPGGATDEEKKAAREMFRDGPMKTGFDRFTVRLKRTEGPFLLGTQFTLADLWCYWVLAMIKAGSFDFIEPSVLDPYPELVACFEAVVAHPTFTAYKAAYDADFTWDF